MQQTASLNGVRFRHKHGGKLHHVSSNSNSSKHHQQTGRWYCPSICFVSLTIFFLPLHRAARQTKRRSTDWPTFICRYYSYCTLSCRRGTIHSYSIFSYSIFNFQEQISNVTHVLYSIIHVFTGEESAEYIWGAKWYVIGIQTKFVSINLLILE